MQFTDPVVRSDTEVYVARACGSEMPDGLWQGWIEFLPIGSGTPVRSGRETTQPNREDALYWATGLTNVYLEGALERALKPPVRPLTDPIPPPVFDAPANEPIPTAPEGILNPFSVYRKGETLLRRQLAALSPWHLVNIILANELSALPTDVLNVMDAPELIELIVTGVRAQTETPTR